MLPDWMATDPKHKHRFLREAQQASALNHPNIVTIYGLERFEGTDFIVMEYVSGQTLGELIPSFGFPPEKALHYARQISAALVSEHTAGIVHRDLKPANVMVAENGSVKVLDFGLAGPVDRPKRGPRHGPKKRPPSLVGGTPDYMAPEQIRGEAGDQRADIFSFGLILYEMLGGTHPFARRSASETMGAIQDRKAPPLPDGIPESLNRIVFRCLEKDPSARYPSAEALSAVLEEVATAVLSEVPIASNDSHPYGRSRVFRSAFAFYGIIGIGALIAAIVWSHLRTTSLEIQPPPLVTSPTVLTPVAAQATPPIVDAVYGRGSQLMEAKRWTEALTLFDEVLRSDPNNTSALYNRAVCLQNLSRWTEAVADFTEVLRRDPKNTDAFYNRGTCLQNLSRSREALADFSEVLKRDPANTRALYNRGICLQDVKRWTEAVADFTEVLHRDRNNTGALYNRALCHMNLRMLREALADLNAAIQIRPSRGAYSNRAIIRSSLGDSAGAKSDQRLAAEFGQ